MNKNAFLNGITEELKTNLKDPTFTHQKAIPFLDKVFSHNTGMTLAGGALGAGVGALIPSEDKKGNKHRLRNALIGGAAGAGLGLGTSFAAPDTSKAINEEMVKDLIRKPIGRVVTNTIDPFDYNAVENAKGQTLTNRFKAIIHDKSLNAVPSDRPSTFDKPGYPDANGYSERDPIFRAAFSLPSRTPKFDHLFNKDKNTWSFNPNDPSGAEHLARIGGVDEGENPGEYYLASGYDGIMGRYLKKTVDPKTTMYDDTWDFNLHPDESLGTLTNIQRYLMNKIINPIRTTGTIANDQIDNLKATAGNP